MEYVPGGDFRTLLNNSGVLKEEHARYYIAEMFAGVWELHNLGYIHRDLKPEVGPLNFADNGFIHHLRVEFFGGWLWSCQVDRLWSRHRSAQPPAH